MSIIRYNANDFVPKSASQIQQWNFGINDSKRRKESAETNYKS